MPFDLQGELQRISGTSFGAATCANLIANFHVPGTAGLEIVGALNVAAGTSGLDLAGACNALAGTSGLGVTGALSLVSPI